MDETEQPIGEALLDSLSEVAAWKRGEIELPTRRVDPMPPKRIRAIRRSVARTARDFERQFGISAATLSNWEQGRCSPDLAARALLIIIEREPGAALRAMGETA